MHDLPLTSLRAFAAVYETGGIRPAGRRLGVTHSSISRHLRTLEAWIGAPLFVDRDHGHSLAFTPEGEALGKSVLASLASIDTVVAAVRESKRANSVTVSTTPSFAVRWLLPRLPAFEAAHPAIEVSVVVDQQRKQPREEGADIAIRMGRGPWPDEHCHPLMNDRLYPVMSVAYWEETGRPQRVEDLTRLRLLHDRDPNTAWAVWKKAYGPPALDVRRGSRFTSSDLVLRAAEQGMGVALARDRLCSEALHMGVLVRPFGLKAIVLKDAHWLILGQQPVQRQRVQTMIDWLLAEAGGA